MLLNFEERFSDSPFVDRIWRTVSMQDGPFTSVAFSRWQMCVWRHQGQTNVTVRGPETKATPAYVPPDAEFFGIVFKLGTFMPDLPASTLVDDAVTLPDASDQSFYLQGSAWEFPTYDNADAFIDRLIRQGQLVHEPLVPAVMQDQPQPISVRSVQRRFLQATGVTHTAARQIDRARNATVLLQQGLPILDVVEQTGYFDQPHLTRSLKYYVGLTPAQISRQDEPEQLSYLYKTLTSC